MAESFLQVEIIVICIVVFSYCIPIFHFRLIFYVFFTKHYLQKKKTDYRDTGNDNLIFAQGIDFVNHLTLKHLKTDQKSIRSNIPRHHASNRQHTSMAAIDYEKVYLWTLDSTNYILSKQKFVENRLNHVVFINF